MKKRHGGGATLNKKAFTLIELLAVIVILSIIAIIATPIISNIINDAKYESEIMSIDNYGKAIELAVTNYAMKNSGKKPMGAYTTTDGILLTLKGDDSKKLIVEYDGEAVKCDTIKVTEDGGVYLANCSIDDSIIDYTYGKPPMCVAVTEATTGTVPDPGIYKKGDEYKCKVDPTSAKPYTFFIISANIGNEVTTDLNAEGITSYNLIMNANINESGEVVDGNQTQGAGYVEWVNKVDYNDDVNYGSDGKNNKGPITAMKYLSKATKNWKNLKPMTFTYDEITENEGKYGYNKLEMKKGIVEINPKGLTQTLTIKSDDNGTTNLVFNARLPKKGELNDAGCTGDSNSCPLWLSNYLKADPSVPRPNVVGANSYLTISSNASRSNYASFVNYDGSISSYYVWYNYGVRPVITVSKFNLS